MHWVWYRFADIEREGDLGGFGNADVFADQVVSQDIQPELAGGVSRNHQPEWQDNLVAVAIVHDLTLDHGQEVRDGPDEVANGAAGYGAGAAMDELRRQAGIAGIAPIDMPARVHVHFQGGHDGLARHDGAALGNQLDAGMAAIDRRSSGRRKRAEQNGHKQAGNKTDHQEAFIGTADHMPANGAGMKYLAHS